MCFRRLLADRPSFSSAGIRAGVGSVGVELCVRFCDDACSIVGGFSYPRGPRRRDEAGGVRLVCARVCRWFRAVFVLLASAWYGWARPNPWRRACAGRVRLSCRRCRLTHMAYNKRRMLGAGLLEAGKACI